MLAKYGIYLRDKRFQLCNVIIDLKIASDVLEGRIPSLTKKGYSGPVGDFRFRSERIGGALGDGDASLLDFATCLPLFNEIRCHMEACERDKFTAFSWRSPESWVIPTKWLKKFHINHNSLANYAERAIVQIRQDVIAIYNFVEWIGD